MAADGDADFDVDLEQGAPVGVLVVHDDGVAVVPALLLVESAVPVPQVVEHLNVDVAGNGFNAGSIRPRRI